MAIIQISKIQVRSGDLVDLPQLDEAEFGFANDEKRLFIGKTTPNENVEILTAYSSLGFSQIAGANGANLSLSTFEDGQVLAISDVGGNIFVTNRGGTKGGEINLGAIGNITITGGSSGQVLTTDGTGNLSWSAGGGSGGSPGGNSTEVQFNSSGSFAGDSGFTYSSGTLSVPTNVNTLNVSANSLALLYANGLITGVNIATPGNVSASNVSATADISATANITGGNIITGGTVFATGNITGGNINTAGQLVSTIATGTAPLSVASTTLVPNLHAETADTATTAGTATTATSATTAGTVTTNAQPNIESVGTLSSLSVTATVTAGNLSTSGNLSVTGGYANVTGVVNINSANITLTGANGFIYTIGDIAANNISVGASGLGVLYSNGLITSTGLSIKDSGGPTANIVLYGNGDATIKGTSIFEGNISVQQKSNLGPASNVIITGGTNGYFLQTDGAGNLSWAVAGGGGSTVPGGSNTQIQFNDAGSFGGNNNFTFNKVSGNVQIPGNVDIGENLILGNAAAGNVSINLRDANGANTDTSIFYNSSGPERIGVKLNNSDRLTIAASYNELTGNLIIASGNLSVTTIGTFELANSNATTIQAFGTATAIAIGATGSTVNLRGNLVVDKNINFVDSSGSPGDTSIYYAPSPEGIYTVINGATKFVIGNTGGTINYGNFVTIGDGIGYATGSGGTVIQTPLRSSGVTINKPTGSITLASALGTTSWGNFTVTNSTVAATDTIIVNQKSGTDEYQIFVTNIIAGSFRITFATTGGTTTEQPVFNFNVIKGVTS